MTSFISKIIPGLTATLGAIAMLLALSITGPFSTPAAAQSACKGMSKSACESSNSCSYVKAFTRKDGAKVKAFCRAKPGGGAKKSVKKSTTKKTATKKTTAKKTPVKKASAKKSDAADKPAKKTAAKKPATKKKTTKKTVAKKKKTTKKKKTVAKRKPAKKKKKAAVGS